VTERSLPHLRSHQRGRSGEQAAAEWLRYMGLQHVVSIETGMRKIGGEWRHARPVAGDIRAVIPGSGRSVLAEVKARQNALVWSDLAVHQPVNLDEHARAGGVSLLIWRHRSGVAVMLWRPPGFGPGQRMTVPQAEALSLPRFFWQGEIPQPPAK